MTKLRTSRSGTGVKLAVLAALAVLIGLIAPAGADAGPTYGLSASYGEGHVNEQPDAKNGSIRFVVYTADEACDSHGIRFDVTFYLNGGEEIQGGFYDNDKGCHTVNTFVTTFSVGQLKGNRSGYFTGRLCKRAGISDTACKTGSWPWKI